MATLNGARVAQIFLDCLFQAGEDKIIPVGGILCNAVFGKKRLEVHKVEISALLDELPDSFKEFGGGGMSFLRGCEDKYCEQWTDSQTRVDQLFQLGMGIGKVKCLVPRQFWPALPGGMPYYQIK